VPFLIRHWLSRNISVCSGAGFTAHSTCPVPRVWNLGKLSELSLMMILQHSVI